MITTWIFISPKPRHHHLISSMYLEKIRYCTFVPLSMLWPQDLGSLFGLYKGTGCLNNVSIHVCVSRYIVYLTLAPRISVLGTLSVCVLGFLSWSSTGLLVTLGITYLSYFNMHVHTPLCLIFSGIVFLGRVSVCTVVQLLFPSTFCLVSVFCVLEKLKVK